MSLSPNPGSAPAAAGPTSFRAPAAQVEAGRGWAWIVEGWGLFKQAPLLWMAVFLILFALQFLLGLVPFVGTLASLLVGPLFMVGILAFAQGARDGKADLAQLFVAFREKTGPLLLVALLYALAIVVVVVIAVVAIVVLGASSMAAAGVDTEQLLRHLVAGGSGLLLSVMILMAVAAIFLIAAAYWFAPGLVFYADMGAAAAMKASLAACLRNWLPFLLYGIVSMLVLLGGTLVLLIGLLVAVPVLMASYYPCFRDLFGQDS